MVDLKRAARLNKELAVRLGWNDHFNAIIEELGLDFSPDDEQFAEALADWQGRTGLQADGILGPASWAVLSEAIGVSSTGPSGPTGSPPLSSTLRWPGVSPSQLAFMRQVYEIHVQRSASAHRFVASLPASELAFVEEGSTEKLRRPAARACSQLLAAARSALATARTSGDADARNIKRFYVSSGYRSVESQLGLWQTNFPRYYDDTSTKRAAAPGGAHGEQAARLTARYIGGRLGAPGYSLHNDGRAVDLRAEVVDGNPLRADSQQSYEWRRSWLFSWLVDHAGLFGFHQNDAIDEPWHWEYRAVP